MAFVRGLARRLPFWIVTTLVVTVAAFVVVQITEDDAPPYEEGTVQNVAWAGFLVAGLALCVLCLIAAVQLMRRDT